MKRITQRVVFAALFPFLSFPFLSCANAFTHSLASWAKRDPEKLMPQATPGNVGELVEFAERDPDLSLVLLNRIAGSHERMNPAMQEAALQAAVNAAGMTNALLSSITDLDSDFAQTAPDFLAGAIGNTHNLAATAEAMMRVFPSAAEFNAMGSPYASNHYKYFELFNAADVAAAAIVLFAADFQASGSDMTTYMSGGQGPLWTYGEYLARSVMGRPGAVSGALGDFVQALFL